MLYGLGIVGVIVFSAFLPIPHFEWNTPEMYGRILNAKGEPIDNAIVSIHGAKHKVQIAKTDKNGNYLAEPNKSFHFFIATQVKSYECRPDVYVTHPNYGDLHTQVSLHDRTICKGDKIQQDFVLPEKKLSN